MTMKKTKVNILNRTFEVVTNEQQDHNGYEQFWNLVNSGSWEANTFQMLEKFVTPNVVYLDIGAWIGPTFLFAAQTSKVAYGF